MNDARVYESCNEREQEDSAIDPDWECCSLRLASLRYGVVMAAEKGIFTRETFRFFRDLGRNNRLTWMDKNRERYRTALVQPMRRFLEELTPAILDLDDRFDT